MGNGEGTGYRGKLGVGNRGATRVLLDGTRNTGLTVQPDSTYPGMWRLHYPDGIVSDMVNISRATDAAFAWLSRTSGRGNAKGANWKRPEKRTEQRGAR